MGVAPIIGFNYGAENKSELQNIFRKSVTILGITNITMFVMAEVLTVPMAKIFVGYNQTLNELTIRGMRIYSVAFLVMGFNGEKADAIKESFIDAFEWMSNQITQTFQSKWARYNHIVGYRESRKQQVSCSARDMNVWKHEKHPLDHEIAQLERELQPSLPFASEVLS